MTTAPDFAEPFHGWRVWRVADTPRGLRLWSVLYDEEWDPRFPFAAECRAGASATHPAPARNCKCGIYAARSVTSAGRYLLGRDDSIVVDRVIGVVALWGNVFEAVRGWRASRAYPIRIWVPQSLRAGEIVECIETYGVRAEITPARRAADVAAAVAIAA